MTDHVLAMTATPIPPHVQLALSGVARGEHHRNAARRRGGRSAPHIANLHARAPLRHSLRREKSRRGQSFFVCPHIDDLAPLATKSLRGSCPDIQVVTLACQAGPQRVDAAMIRFAEGEGDCLLATNIVESGLDLPAANTMVIWRPDRFGLGQLHQLSRARGSGAITPYWLTCYVLPTRRAFTPATRRRLATLTALDRPGAGFTISARDLDLRGAGDLFGAPSKAARSHPLDRHGARPPHRGAGAPRRPG